MIRHLAGHASRRDWLIGLGASLAAFLTPRSGTAEMSSSLLERTIPSSGERVPAIGLGTWQTFDVGRSEPERAPLRDVLERFAGHGGRVVDSSPMYGRAEQTVGDLARELRLHDRLFLATKVWTRGKAAGVQQMETSLQRLGTDRVDLLQVHNLLDAANHLDTLAEWKREGRVRYVGVTHYTASAHDDLERAIRDHALDFVQVNLSVVEREAERRLLPLAADRGVAVVINRPFAEGALFGAVRSRPLPSFAADLDCASWAQLFLKYVLGHPAVTVVIPATSNPRHLDDNMAAGRGRMPDAAERERIVRAVLQR